MMDSFIHPDEMWSSRHCCFTAWWDVYSIIIIIEIIIDCYAKDNLTYVSTQGKAEIVYNI